MKPWYRALPALLTCNRTAKFLYSANAAVVDYVMDHGGTSVYLDASKSPWVAMMMSASPLFDVNLILLIRDGRAWFNSALRRHPGLPPEHVAQSFATSVRDLRQVVGKWPSNKVINVCYESLCEDTENVLADVFSRMGLDPAERWLDYRRPGRHIIGNATVVSATSDVIADPCLWRQQLSQAELSVFERIAGDVNRSLGYQ
jgi:hypothetical protein